MWWLAGLAIGAVLGAWIRVPLPIAAAPYAAMIVLAVSDAVAGGLLARVRGAFQGKRFFEGLIANALLACAFAFLGQRFDIPLYQAGGVALAVRIFGNVSKLRSEKENDGELSLRPQK